MDEILRFRRRRLSDAEVQAAIEELVAAQTLNPELPDTSLHRFEGDAPRRLLRNLLSVVHGYREDI